MNWRYEKPNEFTDKIYDTKSEIYFIGKLFEEILVEIENVDFQYLPLLSKMVLPYSKRYSSFFDIYREIINQIKTEIDFSGSEKQAYREFADNLVKIISKVPYGIKYNKDIEEMIRALEEVYKNSILEEIIQNNNKLITIFLDGQYKFWPKLEFKVSTLNSMIRLLKSSSEDRKKVILNNLWERFDKVDREYEEIDEDLPF